MLSHCLYSAITTISSASGIGHELQHCFIFSLSIFLRNSIVNWTGTPPNIFFINFLKWFISIACSNVTVNKDEWRIFSMQHPLGLLDIDSNYSQWWLLLARTISGYTASVTVLATIVGGVGAEELLPWLVKPRFTSPLEDKIKAR